MSLHDCTLRKAVNAVKTPVKSRLLEVEKVIGQVRHNKMETID